MLWGGTLHLGPNPAGLDLAFSLLYTSTLTKHPLLDLVLDGKASMHGVEEEG